MKVDRNTVIFVLDLLVAVAQAVGGVLKQYPAESK